MKRSTRGQSCVSASARTALANDCANFRTNIDGGAADVSTFADDGVDQVHRRLDLPRATTPTTDVSTRQQHRSRDTAASVTGFFLSHGPARVCQ
jgi:hypothetical protein|eukprot:SAG25_NODE_1245_length_3510_cov_1468.316431_8_plen_94_part_00